MKKNHFITVMAIVMAAAAFSGCGDSRENSREEKTTAVKNSSVVSVHNEKTEETADSSKGLSDLVDEIEIGVELPSGTPTETGECGEDGDNVIYELYDNNTVVIKGSGRMKDYSHVETLRFSPLHGNIKIRKAIILPGVTSVGSAFFADTSVDEVYLPDGITDIYQAFISCNCLKKVEIPDSVTTIGESAFSGCSQLTELTIPDSVTTIEDYAFSHCNKLTELTIPDSVTEIGEDVFTDCDALTVYSSVESPAYKAAKDCHVKFDDGTHNEDL